MNQAEADAFFEDLEKGLNEEFTIPKKRKEDVAREKEEAEALVKQQEEEARLKVELKTSAYGKKPRSEQREVMAENPPSPKKFKPSFNSQLSGVETEQPTVTYGEVRTGGDRAGLSAWQSLYDRKLPQELLDKCNAKRCGLCEVDFTSPIVAKSHYLGKNHTKKTSVFFDEWSQKTNQESPVKLSDDADIIRTDQDQSFCNVCQLRLSSKIVAVAHYQGKKHVANVKYFGKVNPVPTPDGSGNFGIGLPFRKMNNTDDVQEHFERKVSGNNGWVAAPNSALANNGAPRRSFCLPCKMYFTNDEYDGHVSSDEHKSKTLASGEKPFYCSLCMIQHDAENDFEAHLQSNTHKSRLASSCELSIDSLLSSVRNNTMSIYWCDVCNLQCTGKKDFEIHTGGRKHRNRDETSQQLRPLSHPPTSNVLSAFRCEICLISTTDQAGLDGHYKGKKHMKKAANGRQGNE